MSSLMNKTKLIKSIKDLMVETLDFFYFLLLFFIVLDLIYGHWFTIFFSDF